MIKHMIWRSNTNKGYDKAHKRPYQIINIVVNRYSYIDCIGYTHHPYSYLKHMQLQPM